MRSERIMASRIDIADVVDSGNKVYLNADSLLLNLRGGDAHSKFEKGVESKKKGSLVNQASEPVALRMHQYHL